MTAAALKERLRRALPPPVLEAIRFVRPEVRKTAAMVAPVRDYVRILRLTESRGLISPVADVSVRIRPLGNIPVSLRSGASDASVVLDTFLGRYHLPPPELEPRVIWDLGANIGLTVAHYAVLFPNARVVGVEPEPTAAAIARRNVAPWHERCRIIEAAAWHCDCEVLFATDPGNEFGSRVTVAAVAGSRAVTAKSLSTLLADETCVDFLKVDVEGAEEQLLTQRTQWAAKVRCLKVEVHPPYSVERCVNDLERLGFAAEIDERHWAAVLGLRRP